MPKKKMGKGGTRKVGRNKIKCGLYRTSGRERHNAIRRAKTLLHRLTRENIRPVDRLVLSHKIDRLQRMAA
jgi:beta-lactamase superfamily II metal-dependent hydrolase